MDIDRLASHSTGDTFLIFQEEVPQEYAFYSGRLYKCGVCKKSVTCNKNVGKGCKKGRP